MTIEEKICGMKMYKLGDLCSDVVDCPHSTPEWKNEGIRVIRNFNIVNGSLDFSNGFFVDEETFEKRTQRACPEFEDLVISREAPMGAVCMIPKDLKCCLGQRLVLLKINKELADPSYILFTIQSQFVQKQIQVIDQTGSIVSNLNIPDLKSLRIPLPSLPEQKKIASVLSALDDKIALNKKMNQKLEAMAKRLYDYWFVQYDFPDKNGHPYKTTGGPMTYNTTLKREIPEGWEVVDINELCQVVDCLHSKKPDFCYEDENSYLLALENITKEGYIDLSDKYYISKKDFAEWTSRICVRENDFLFTNAGRAGDMGMVPEGVLCAIGRNITAVRPEKINPWYLRCFFKSLYMQEQILNNLDQGSFFMSFNVRSIKKLQVLMPSEPLMKKFDSFIEPHLKRIEKNNKEISRLKKLRDKLLPLLMNGQVVVG